MDLAKNLEHLGGLEKSAAHQGVGERNFPVFDFAETVLHLRLGDPAALDRPASDLKIVLAEHCAAL